MKDYTITGLTNVKNLEILEKLGDILPHGSGIDYTWSIEQKKNKFIYASNSFHAMDEFGGYCHIYDFTAKYKYNGADNYIPCEICKGKGIRYVKDMRQYHPNMSDENLKEFLERDGDIKVIGSKYKPYFHCNFCKGLGKIKLHTYELFKINFHGQHEYTCCGIGIKDYLYQVLYLD